MANLFLKQAKKYVETRPTYPPELFQFIFSKCPNHHLAWDVGTGNGQAAFFLAEKFDKIIATDTSPQQLAHATPHPKINYHLTPATMSTSDLTRHVAAPGTVDLITVAQAIHWLDPTTFFSQVRHLLKPNGVLAAWTYTLPIVEPRVDKLSRKIYDNLRPYWAPERRLVEEELRTIEFPMDVVEGENDTGPFEFAARKEMNLEGYVGYLQSWSAYVTAKEAGMEFIGEEVVKDLEEAWRGREEMKVVNFPIFLRIGRVVD